MASFLFRREAYRAAFDFDLEEEDFDFEVADFVCAVDGLALVCFDET